jgi:hypothetical protein
MRSGPGLHTVKIEGLTPQEILALPQEQLDALVLTGKPLVFQAGTATILGEFKQSASGLKVELAQIDGGGEGVLPTLWVLTERYAKQRGLSQVEWIVHAVNCARPNPKLRRVLQRKGFKIQSVGGVEVYYLTRSLGEGR